MVRVGDVVIAIVANNLRILDFGLGKTAQRLKSRLVKQSPPTRTKGKQHIVTLA
jgi:hypothetical protein